VFAKPTVRVGDRFVKVGQFQSAVWIVNKIFQLPAEPAHAQLGKEGDNHESITVSLPALADPRFFKRAG
jgi:hypothetical protein